MIYEFTGDRKLVNPYFVELENDATKKSSYNRIRRAHAYRQ